MHTTQEASYEHAATLPHHLNAIKQLANGIQQLLYAAQLKPRHDDEADSKRAGDGVIADTHEESSNDGNAAKEVIESEDEGSLSSGLNLNDFRNLSLSPRPNAATAAATTGDDVDVAAMKECVNDVFERLQKAEIDRQKLVDLNILLEKKLRIEEQLSECLRRENHDLEGVVNIWQQRYSNYETHLHNRFTKSHNFLLRKAAIRHNNLQLHNHRLQQALRQLLSRQEEAEAEAGGHNRDNEAAATATDSNAGEDTAKDYAAGKQQQQHPHAQDLP